MVIFDPDEILATLDACCDSYTFPMLDNGYVYLAATRLSLYRSETDWAMVIEVFGFSPRAGQPDTHIQTFASQIQRLEPIERNRDKKPHNDSHFIYPISEGEWQDEEQVTLDAKSIELREQTVPLPELNLYETSYIELEEAPRIQTFELCRCLAETYREQLLATAEERRIHILPDMTQILQLEEWHHPNVVYEEDRPSGSETFQQLAYVLATGDTAAYSAATPPNTHWLNWPEGGTL